MSAHEGKVPDLLLERYRLGELPREQHEALERRLSGDAEARQRLRDLADSDRQMEREHPSEWLAGQVRERLRARASQSTSRPPRRRWALPLALVPAAAALVAVVHLSGRVPPPEVPAEPARPEAAAPAASADPQEAPVVAGTGDRVKGLHPSLVLYRKRATLPLGAGRGGEGGETLADGAHARAGDVVRVAYRAAGRGYGVIVSVDGRGALTRHLPASGRSAARLRPGATVLLDSAYELDDAPRFERFHLVTSEAPFAVEPVLAAARAAAAQASTVLDLPPAFEQSTFTLLKEESR